MQVAISKVGESIQITLDEEGAQALHEALTNPDCKYPPLPILKLIVETGEFLEYR